MEKKNMGQDKDSLIKQNQRPCAEAKGNKRFIFHFPSAGDVQPPPRKEGFSIYSDCSRRQLS